MQVCVGNQTLTNFACNGKWLVSGSAQALGSRLSSKLEITQGNDGTINVTFPRESIDNQLFFLNPILPAHHLTNQKLNYYQNQFASNPVTSACAKLKPQATDKDSIIFDLANCDEYAPQILQVKQFSNNT